MASTLVDTSKNDPPLSCIYIVVIVTALIALKQWLYVLWDLKHWWVWQIETYLPISIFWLLPTLLIASILLVFWVPCSSDAILLWLLLAVLILSNRRAKFNLSHHWWFFLTVTVTIATLLSPVSRILIKVLVFPSITLLVSSADVLLSRLST